MTSPQRRKLLQEQSIPENKFHVDDTSFERIDGYLYDLKESSGTLITIDDKQYIIINTSQPPDRYFIRQVLPIDHLLDQPPDIHKFGELANKYLEQGYDNIEALQKAATDMGFEEVNSEGFEHFPESQSNYYKDYDSFDSTEIPEPPDYDLSKIQDDEEKEAYKRGRSKKKKYNKWNNDW